MTVWNAARSGNRLQFDSAILRVLEDESIRDGRSFEMRWNESLRFNSVIFRWDECFGGLHNGKVAVPRDRLSLVQIQLAIERWLTKIYLILVIPLFRANALMGVHSHKVTKAVRLCRWPVPRNPLVYFLSPVLFRRMLELEYIDS